jgi:hypothetical protein
MIAVLTFLYGSTVMASEAPLKVYIMAGQSNMQGSAHFRTFKAIGDDPETSALLNVILDQNGDPVLCGNAWITYFRQQDKRDTVLQGKIKVGYGFDHERIGPEYAFGLYLDKAHHEPVLIIKTAWGGKSLAVDFRPPGAGPYVPGLKEKEQGNAPANDVVGHYYREMIRHVRETLISKESIRRIVPGYDPEQGYELAGFVWFQGWNDMCNRHHLEQYTGNMVHYRGNVIAVDSGPYYELGLNDIYWKQRLTNEWKWRVKQGGMTRREASKEGQRYGFAGGGLTKKEQRIRDRCASNAEYHYLGSGKTFVRFGKALAEAMLGMEKK